MFEEARTTAHIDSWLAGRDEGYSSIIADSTIAQRRLLHVHLRHKFCQILIARLRIHPVHAQYQPHKDKFQKACFRVTMHDYRPYARQLCADPHDAVQQAFLKLAKQRTAPQDPVAWL